MTARLHTIVVLSLLAAQAALAQHDISKVDVVEPGRAVATPLTDTQEKLLEKYEIPELAGARQALGSQLVDGRLPRPLLDFVMKDGPIQQRLSIFEGGLVVVRMTGAGGEIRKKLLIPDDALKAYLGNASASRLELISPHSLLPPEKERRARLRVYGDNGRAVERAYHPAGMLPKSLSDQVMPLQDLLRAVSEDRTVTSTVSGYEPKIGDELVGDDQQIYRVVNITESNGMVELQCLGNPTRMWVSKKEMYNHFIGAAPKKTKDVLTGTSVMSAPSTASRDH
ncbi:MAG TPA: hypothetical protein VGF69_09770 [Thermoanaerobaculia bacterium]|jgi:hypothetical protein